MTKVSDGLTKIDESGDINPSIAKRWDWQEDGKKWTFYLDENVKWQDGKKITSQSINYNFEDVKIDKPNQSTIVFTLKTPLSFFPAIVAKPIFRTGLLGTGKYKVAKISLNGEFVDKLIIRNSDGDNIVYKFYPTEDRAMLAFKTGEVDILESILDDQPVLFWPTAKITKIDNPNQILIIFFNFEDKFLSERKLRQALSYAIDKENLGQTRAYGPVSPTSWAYNPQVKPYDFDPQRSKELIDQLEDPVKKNLELNLISSPILLDSAEKIANDWKRVGIKTNVKVSASKPDQYQAYLAIIEIPRDPDQYAIWHSSQTLTNITHYNNKRIDKLLEDGRFELNKEARKKIYLDFQRFLLEDAPAVFLSHPETYKIERR
ncbi:MAG: ABC transporter substrate-binding protein [Patescibacteria group bacterium]